jgi:hypothetical protein
VFRGRAICPGIFDGYNRRILEGNFSDVAFEGAYTGQFQLQYLLCSIQLVVGCFSLFFLLFPSMLYVLLTVHLNTSV